MAYSKMEWFLGLWICFAVWSFSVSNTEKENLCYKPEWCKASVTMTYPQTPLLFSYNSSMRGGTFVMTTMADVLLLPKDPAEQNDTVMWGYSVSIKHFPYRRPLVQGEWWMCLSNHATFSMQLVPLSTYIIDKKDSALLIYSVVQASVIERSGIGSFEVMADLCFSWPPTVNVCSKPSCFQIPNDIHLVIY